MIIKSYEIRNSLGLINTIERTSMGWFDNVAKKTLNQSETDELLKLYRSFNCQLQSVYDEPELPHIPYECVAIEFITKEAYTGKEVKIYTAIRLEDDNWLFGINIPSAATKEKFIRSSIKSHTRKGIEVRYLDDKSKRIEC